MRWEIIPLILTEDCPRCTVSDDNADCRVVPVHSPQHHSPTSSLIPHRDGGRNCQTGFQSFTLAPVLHSLLIFTVTPLLRMPCFETFSSSQLPTSEGRTQSPLCSGNDLCFYRLLPITYRFIIQFLLSIQLVDYRIERQKILVEILINLHMFRLIFEEDNFYFYFFTNL